jgi:PAS domain S-box-containing protein
MISKKGSNVYISSGYTRLTGYSREDIDELGERYSSLFHPDDRAEIIAHWESLKRSTDGEILEIQYRFKTAAGKWIWCESRDTPFERYDNGGVKQCIGTFLDITDRKGADEQIKASLKEKEVMLREIHHRVKNNLALVSSLLSLRSEYSDDESSQEMFEEVKTRIRSMAVAHEILYQSDNLAHLDVSDYIDSLKTHLLYSHGSVGAAVIVDQAIEEVSFGIDTAIPLGLLLTELVSNCLKHAFPGGRTGKISISLRKINGHEFELIVADDGIGIPREHRLE